MNRRPRDVRPTLCFRRGKGQVDIGEGGSKGDEAFSPVLGCFMINAEYDCEVCCRHRLLGAGVDCGITDSPSPSPGSPTPDCWESSNERPQY